MKEPTIDQKKDLLIAAFMAYTELDDFNGFTPEDTAKLKTEINKATKGGVLDIYGDGDKFNKLVDLTAKVVAQKGMGLGLITEEGDYVNEPKSKQTGPVWS